MQIFYLQCPEEWLPQLASGIKVIWFFHIFQIVFETLAALNRCAHVHVLTLKIDGSTVYNGYADYFAGTCTSAWSSAAWLIKSGVYLFGCNGNSWWLFWYQLFWFQMFYLWIFLLVFCGKGYFFFWVKILYIYVWEGPKQWTLGDTCYDYWSDSSCTWHTFLPLRSLHLCSHTCDVPYIYFSISTYTRLLSSYNRLLRIRYW